MTPDTTLDHLNPATISALIDAELPAAEAQAAQQHLSACHDCTLRVLAATQLKSATARAAHRFKPTADTLARLTAQLQPQQQRKPARLLTFRPVLWAALAATIILFAILFSYRQLHQANTLTAELLDQHLATLSPAATPQVLSSDRHTVKPWFQGKLPFSFNLPEPTVLPPDTTLQGADLTFLEGQPAAQLLFTIHKHKATVFITQRDSTHATTQSTRSGFTLHTATTLELRLAAVSDVNPSDLDALLSALVKVQ